MLVRRIGRPGLLGAVARTAVVAGTATMTANAVNRRAQAKAQDRAEAEMYEQQQMAAAAVPPPAPPSEEAAGQDLVDRLTQLAQLHQQGALTDAQFEGAKAKLLS